MAPRERLDAILTAILDRIVTLLAIALGTALLGALGYDLNLAPTDGRLTPITRTWDTDQPLPPGIESGRR